MDCSRVPISLMIDDSAPGIHVYASHCRDVHGKTTTGDGRALLPFVPNSFLDAFVDVASEHGLAGKLSIVPNPGGAGPVPEDVTGVPPQEAQAWLDIAQSCLGDRFDFCPEMITHNLTVDLTSGRFLSESEHDWSQRQDRTSLTPYIAEALRILRDAGVKATGVTSPWRFGADVVGEYEAAIVAAQQNVYNRSYSWYFCHTRTVEEGAYPWIAVQDDDSVLIHIPQTVTDAFWDTIDTPRADAGFVHEVAGSLLTEDGESGAIREVLDGGGWPILVTHWQSLFSNGSRTGLAALAEVARRVNATLADRVAWHSCGELCERLTGRPMV